MAAILDEPADFGENDTNYHTCGQTRKPIIDYYEEFEQAQNEW